MNFLVMEVESQRGEVAPGLTSDHMRILGKRLGTKLCCYLRYSLITDN